MLSSRGMEEKLAQAARKYKICEGTFLAIGGEVKSV